MIIHPQTSTETCLAGLPMGNLFAKGDRPSLFTRALCSDCYDRPGMIDLKYLDKMINASLEEARNALWQLREDYGFLMRLAFIGTWSGEWTNGEGERAFDYCPIVCVFRPTRIVPDNPPPWCL